MDYPKPVVHIENWTRTAHFGGEILTGNVQDHPRFAPGAFVYTSRILGETTPAVIETRNTFYVLGKPAEQKQAAETVLGVED